MGIVKVIRDQPLGCFIRTNMLSNTEINLTGLLPPICLLQCKKQLSEMAPGDIICVCLQDQEILRDLVLIIERSKDKIIKQQMEADAYRIYIQKG